MHEESPRDEKRRARRDPRATDSRRGDPAQPLRVSWDPASEDGSARRRPEATREASRRGVPFGKRLRAYGWRVYALPALVVLTLFVVADTATDLGGTEPTQQGSSAQSDPQSDPQSDQAGDDGQGQQPPVREVPPDAVDLDIPTAQLPDGGDYSEEGDGSWEILEGSSDQVGEDGELYTYTVEVEEGIDAADYGGNDAFAQTVEAVLADSRSWIGSGDVLFQRVGDAQSEPDFRVSLTSPSTVREPDVCGYAVEYEASCYRGDIDRVVLNLARWVRGAEAFESDIGMYRQYLVNHEVGHVLGLGHVGCAEEGDLAPVMMQQSFGVDNDYLAELSEDATGEQGSVPADGATCRPNAWPNPEGADDG